MHETVADAPTEKDARERLAHQGYLVYSVKAKDLSARLSGVAKRQKINLEKFLIFNQQFLTLIRAGLPILQSLDLLAERYEARLVQLYQGLRSALAPFAETYHA